MKLSSLEQHHRTRRSEHITAQHLKLQQMTGKNRDSPVEEEHRSLFKDQEEERTTHKTRRSPLSLSEGNTANCICERRSKRNWEGVTRLLRDIKKYHTDWRLWFLTTTIKSQNQPTSSTNSPVDLARLSSSFGLLMDLRLFIIIIIYYYFYYIVFYFSSFFSDLSFVLSVCLSLDFLYTFVF